MRLIICFFLGLIPFAWANTPEETPLLPEVQKLLTLSPIDESTMNQNAYVALTGMNAPSDMDPIEVGKKIILNNFKALQASYKARDITLGEAQSSFKGYFPKEKAFNINLEVDEGKYLFPCRAYYPTNCLDQVLRDRKTIELLIVRNNGLLQRYAQIIKLPDFDYYYSSATSPLPMYQSLMGLMDLRLSKAIFTINDRYIDQGLAILQENIDFAKQMLSGRGTIIDTMIAINQLAKTYHIISELIDTNLLSIVLNNSQLIALLEPLSAKEQQSLMVSMKSEFSMILSGIYYYNTDETIRKGFGTKDKERVVDLNASINFIYEENALLLEIFGRVLPESGKYYREYLANNKIDNQIRLLTSKNSKKYAKKNIMESTTTMSDFGKMSIKQEGYLYRLYDLSSYLVLVNAQLKIKQADIKMEDIPKFLVKMGNDAKNPYSNKSFVWDEKTQTLSSDWLSTRNKTEERDGERATVGITFKIE